MDFKEFDIHLYFTKDYGMGEKPSEGSLNGFKVFFGIMLIVVGIIVAVALPPRKMVIGIIVMIVLLVFGLAIMLPPIFSTKKNKAKADAWQAEFDHRKNTWDSKYDTFLQAKLDAMDIKQTAMHKLGITDEQVDELKPFFIRGNILNGAKDWFRIDANGVVRADHNEITWLFFSKDQLYLYNIKFRLTSQGKAEITQEMFYKDIVSISTVTDHLVIDKKNCVDGSVINPIGVVKLKICVPGDKMSFVFTRKSEISDSLQLVKNKIREKKLK